MSSLLILLIILGCVAGVYFKGTFLRSFAMIIATICAGVVAFAYFELLTGILVSKDLLVPWAQAVSFFILFVITSVVLQTVLILLTHKPVDFGLPAERIGRIVCGFFLGFVISGFLLIALAMTPLPSKIPYQRFDAINPDIENPRGALLNPDDFVTGWFSLMSSGSLSGKQSFATLHPAYLDQIFLSRHAVADGISIITRSQVIELPKEKAAWVAPESLRNSRDPNEPIEPRNGCNLTIVRVGIKKDAAGADKFTLSQLRLICKQKDGMETPLAGKGRNVYPVGYVKAANKLEIKKLGDTIKIEQAKDKIKWIDFAFYVPSDSVPVLIEFKQNNIVQAPRLVTAEQIPPTVPF